MYQEIQEKHKERLKKFIVDNGLDYQVIENGISRFHIRSYDGKTLTFYESQGKFILVEYDKDLDDAEKPAFKYHDFSTLNKMMETLSQYDNQLNKVYWQPIMDVTLYGIKDVEENWYENIVEGSTYDDQSKTIIYEDKSYSPVLRSPFNTLHEVSPINTMHLEKLDKLYFEIHPISCNEERYLARILCNTDEKFKEFINFYIWSKKGLKKFVEKLFNDMQQFKDFEKMNEEVYDDVFVFSGNENLIMSKKKRYKEYYDSLISDFNKTYMQDDVDRIWDILKRDCSVYLSEMKRSGSDMLFRGYYHILDNNAVYGMDKRRVRKNRTPKDMNPVVSAELDSLFYDKFGYKLRSESVFVTKDPLTSFIYSGYDKVRKRKQTYIFFPIGDYEYFWSNDIKDLYEWVRDDDWYLEVSLIDESEADRLESCRDDMLSIVDKYRSGDIQLVKDQEVSFICDEYYLVDDAFLFEILKKIENEI